MLSFSQVAVVAEFGKRLEAGLNYAKGNKNATQLAIVAGQQLMQQVQDVLAGKVEFNEYKLNHDIMKYVRDNAHNEKNVKWKDTVRVRRLGHYYPHELAKDLDYKFYAWHGWVYLTSSGNKEYKVCLAEDVK